MGDIFIDILFTFYAKEHLSGREQATLSFFLTASMRHREWEWFQFKDGVVDAKVYMAYFAVIPILLGVPRTRRWWVSVGRTGFDSEFVQEVDKLLAESGLTTYFQDIKKYDNDHSMDI